MQAVRRERYFELRCDQPQTQEKREFQRILLLFLESKLLSKILRNIGRTQFSEVSVEFFILWIWFGIIKLKILIRENIWKFIPRLDQLRTNLRNLALERVSRSASFHHRKITPRCNGAHVVPSHWGKHRISDNLTGGQRPDPNDRSF